MLMKIHSANRTACRAEGRDFGRSPPLPPGDDVDQN